MHLAPEQEMEALKLLVICGCSVYRYYDGSSACTVEKFTLQHEYEPAEPQGSLEVNGNRVISLGRNM